MNLNIQDIKIYVERFLNSIFKGEIKINVVNDYYVLNNILDFRIYKFWEKSDEELLNDFEDCSFKNDYIGTIFFFLSGYWEYIHNDKKDQYGRFIYNESFQYKKNIIEVPIVDILVDNIKEELNLEYKANKSLLFLTHDVDHLSFLKQKIFYRKLFGDIIKRRNFKDALDKILRKIKNNDPYDLKYLLFTHKKLNIKGTFFFLPKKQEKNIDGGYNLLKNQEYLKRIFNEIIKSNGNIGIHYDAKYLMNKDMKKDISDIKSIFNVNIFSGRAHYLIFDITKTFDILEKSGIILDTTGGYAENIGFRFGTSKPFKPYNFNEKREYNLIEVPLIVMEGTLQNKNYMNLTPDDGFNKIKKMIDKIEKYNGIFTFLWHNSSFYTIDWKDWEWIYVESVKYALNKGFLSVNAQDILNIWSENDE
ncbi:hypothetical protein Marpi_1248 [Marinitoga piezophila KA3]|uniref:DUF7033 domain-containing protein n=1 Tax=Marinitoga piezophila (strain DSM 14283 / JCM 11233 / KA3) TaxID=443254 RepID=H2J2W1_MARPK|nr:hypothetical protein [Marinitoga piezophila]AEX85652.1 hypothetical protein Marpi_1248 [Marinitoga piezophila KA3]